MAMGSLELSSITRSQDYTTIKQNEDNKGLIAQTNISQQLEKNTQETARQVNSSDDARWQEKKEDAKEKGSNEYAGDGGKNRKQRESKERMVVKNHQGFDMKI